MARHLHAQPRGQCCHDGGYQNPRQCISREQSLANRNPAPLANVEVLSMSMSYASRKPQSRAETEANARTLRSLVKQPENKQCADCKRNDTRWASWNIGCFLCIRCSGIHRSMGTHISRVKSIDLDIWTPEQMHSIQKWGNKRANAYWEARLKEGHAPPDHKVESFIRSKYELRRWAMDGSPPEDPSVLDADKPSVTPMTTANATTTIPATVSGLSTGARAQAELTSATRANMSGAPEIQRSAPTGSLMDLLNDDTSNSTANIGAAPALTPKPAISESGSASTKNTGRGGGLFDLDWDDTASKDPVPSVSRPTSAPKKNPAKDQILSLFSAPPPSSVKPASLDNPFASMSSGNYRDLTTDMASINLGSSPIQARAPPTSDIFNTQDIWSSPTHPEQSSASSSKNVDVFANIWGDFK